MGRVGSIILASAAFVLLALSTPALAALDSGLRGTILIDDAGANMRHRAMAAVHGLGFAEARDESNSVDYLAAASTRAGYSKTAKQISAAMGYLGAANGAGVIIGIVDTGIDLDHSEFMTAKGASRVLTGTCLAGVSATLCSSADNKIGGDILVWPTVTHGTHVAGIAAGLNVGLASAASILPVRVCDSATGQCPGNIDGGIVWASQHGAKVINVSIGGSILSAFDINAAKIAVANGALIVVAAGNAGNNNPTGGFLAGAALYNGVRGSMIVVGSLGATNQISSFSQEPGNTCMVQSGHSYCMKNYFVVAPGQAIISSVGGTTTGSLSGTSMATPYVSGVAAVIKGLWPYLTMPQVANVIFGTADDLGAPGPDPVYGMGEVDLANATKPAGTTKVITGGKNVTNVTMTVPGVGYALMGGVMSVGVAQNSVLKKVVVIDQFGRDFTADLTKAVRNDGFDISSFVMLDQLMSATAIPGTVQSGLHAVASSGYSPQLGLITMSGLVNTVTTSAAFASNVTGQDAVRSYMSNLAFSASPTEDLSFDMGYKLRLSGRLNEYDAGASPAFNGLFLSASAVNSPYASLTDGGNYAGTTVRVADGLEVRSGYSWLNANGQQAGQPLASTLNQTTVRYQTPGFDQRGANSAVMSVSWSFADWGGLGVVASQTDERNSVLGGITSGALNMARSASTSAIDASMRFDLGKDWMATVAYGEGLTNLNVRPDGLLNSASALRSRSYGIAVATRDITGDDSLGLALSRPMHVYSGSGMLTAATSVDDAGNLVISHAPIAFAAGTPETDLELGYTKAFLEGRVSVQTDAAYQMDVGGQTGRNAVTLISRLRLGL